MTHRDSRRTFQTARGPYFAGSLLLVAALLSVPPGCAHPISAEGRTTTDVSADELDYLWDATLSVLRKHSFQLDRRDRALGVITTLPETSKNFGEFWRQDVADDYSLLESTLHTTQRKVIVRFIRDEADAWHVEVQVDVYRLSQPETQITSASAAIQAYSGVLPTVETGERVDVRAVVEWVHMGRDAALERQILHRIVSS